MAASRRENKRLADVLGGDCYKIAVGSQNFRQFFDLLTVQTGKRLIGRIGQRDLAGANAEPYTVTSFPNQLKTRGLLDTLQLPQLTTSFQLSTQ